MTLLFADALGQYGTAANLGRGTYTQAVNDGESILSVGSDGLPALVLSTDDNDAVAWRYDYAVPGLNFGHGSRWQILGGSPTSQANARTCQGLHIGGNLIFSIYPNPDLGVSLGMGFAGNPIASSAPGILGPNKAWVEWRAFIDPVVGFVECRVNDVVAFLATDLDLGAVETDGFLATKGNGVSSGWDTVRFLVSEPVWWDIDGDMNNDFFGKTTRCRSRFTATNGVDQDWAATGGTAWQQLKTVPTDIGAHNLEAENVGDASLFGLDMIPTNVSFARGIVVHTALTKSDPPASGYTPQISLYNNVYSADEINPPPDDWAWDNQLFERDPVRDGYWSRENLLATMARMERTS